MPRRGGVFETKGGGDATFLRQKVEETLLFETKGGGDVTF